MIDKEPKAYNVKLYPSLLAASWLCFKEMVSLLDTHPAIGGYHIDIMDGHAVPNISFGPKLVSDLKTITDLPLDCHLMVKDSKTWALKVADAGAHTITLHPPLKAEDAPDFLQLVQTLQTRNVSIGIAFAPNSPWSELEPCIKLADFVLCMGVMPGFSGQKFLPNTLERIQKLHQTFPHLPIQVDGGMDAETLPLCYAQGARQFVVGAALFSSGSLLANLSALTSFTKSIS